MADLVYAFRLHYLPWPRGVARRLSVRGQAINANTCSQKPNISPLRYQSSRTGQNARIHLDQIMANDELLKGIKVYESTQVRLCTGRTNRFGLNFFKSRRLSATTATVSAMLPTNMHCYISLYRTFRECLTFDRSFFGHVFVSRLAPWLKLGICTSVDGSEMRQFREVEIV